MKNYLSFETEIKKIETELEKSKDPYNQEGLSEVNTSKISEIESELKLKLGPGLELEPELELDNNGNDATENDSEI